jgi:acetyl esterase/lipase
MKIRTIQFRTLLLTATILLVGLGLSTANEKRAKLAPKSLPGSCTEIYKKIDDIELPIHIFETRNHQPNDKCPAIVFFFGGGWRSGSPQQF